MGYQPTKRFRILHKACTHLQIYQNKLESLMRDSQQKHRSMVLNPWPCVINGDLELHQMNSQQTTSRDTMPITHQLDIDKICKAYIHNAYRLFTQYTHKIHTLQTTDTSTEPHACTTATFTIHKLSQGILQTLDIDT